MSESGLNPVQTWLWSELDDLGIDGVIYCRHILDLLISSKHTFDHRLEEKEQNIFSKIAPGTKRRKQKYSRRSSSFSACEEILWKKEIAVACLLSATETKEDSEDTAATIQHVVDELYNKLAELHLTSEGKRSGSDGDCPLTDHNGNSVPSKKKPVKKENYEDAFPSLDGTTHPTVARSLSDSVWNKTEKSNDPKSENDLNTPQTRGGGYPISHPNSSDVNQLRSRSEGEVTPEVARWDHHCHSLRNSNWRYANARKPRAASTGCTDNKAAQSSFQQSKKPPRPRYVHGGRAHPKYRKSDYQKKRSTEKSSPQKRKFTESKSYTKRVENSKRGYQKTTVRKNLSTKMVKNDMESGECDYAHLPSWMETTLADFSNPYSWSPYDGGWTFQGGIINPTQEEEESEDPPFSNRWYREPDSGLLTFQPLKSGKERVYSSSSSTTLSRPSSSLCGDQEEDELFKDVESDPGASAAPESWMWCPSPSLWEDGQSSPVSRLESVYKRELLSLGAENHVEDISGRIWEEYKTIFLDLQDMDAGSDDESSSDDDQSSFERPDSSIWAPMSSETNLAPNACGFPTVDDTERVTDHKFGIEPMRRRFDLWSESSYGGAEKSVLRNSSYDSLTASSVGEPVIHKSASAESSIWKYSPLQAWSADDGLDQGDGASKIQPDEELATLMQNGAFGYLCQARKQEGWGISPAKNTLYPCHGAQWGEGDFTVTEKPDTPKESYEEEMMHALVDALFSDLSFNLLFGPEFDPEPHSEISQIPSKTPVTPYNPEFPTSLSFDFRSLFVQTPIEDFYSPDNNPWQPQWHMDDIVSQAGLNYLSPFTKLDDLFMSLASAEELDRQYGRLSETAKKKKSFYDSVTENESWKTSVRIGNIWQTISGIRPVNVIYSENKPTPQREEKLIPSAATHFRPISVAPVGADVSDPPGYDSALSVATPLASDEPGIGNSEQDLSDQVNLTEHVEIGHAIHPKLREEPSFQTSFSKLVQDKSMQTAFETSVQQDISSCQEFLPRPPKANSR